MSYLGTAWMNEELQQAIAEAEDDQHAFAIAATAVNETIRVGLGKLTAEVAGLLRETAKAASALEGIEAELGPSGSVADIGAAIRDVNIRSDDVVLTGIQAEDVEAAVAKAMEQPPNGDRTFENDESDDDLLIAPLGGGGFVVGRRDAFRDDDDDEIEPVG